MTKPSSAIDKALAIIEQIAGEARPVSLVQLTEATDLPKQTVHRVLQQLEEAGVVQRGVPPHSFILGQRMRDLGLATLKSAIATLPIRAEMERLVADVGESANLGILNGRSVLYLERVECAWPLRFTINPNDQLPAYAVAIGKLLLANLPAPIRKKLIGREPLERFTERTITDPAALERDLEETRARGYSLNNQEYHPGLVGTAVPVHDGDGTTVAALAIHGVVPRTSLEKLKTHLPRMREAAERISELL